jgi:hypothetical protein
MNEPIITPAVASLPSAALATGEVPWILRISFTIAVLSTAAHKTLPSADKARIILDGFDIFNYSLFTINF